MYPTFAKSFILFSKRIAERKFILSEYKIVPKNKKK